MAGKKKSKKDKKAAKKAKKEARKAAKRASAESARLAAQKAAPKPATQAAKKPMKNVAARVAKKTARKPVKKAAAARKPSPPPRPALESRRQPESLRLRSAGPSFTVNDIDKSLAFYRDVLGFTLKERWEQDGVLHGVEMVAGRVTFWLGQDDWKKGRDRAKGQGFRMYCGTSQDVDVLAERIKAAGGTLTEEPTSRPWGGRDFALLDPDGFAITIASGM
jgi:catechol 2,3-dioxygenase-like lactoylglutathione lyase family enzyme